MADVLEQYQFTQTRGRVAKYPWDEWLDGRIWRVVEGVDTDTNIKSFRAYLYTKASERKIKVLTQYENLDDPARRNALVFRAVV